MGEGLLAVLEASGKPWRGLDVTAIAAAPDNRCGHIGKRL